MNKNGWGLRVELAFILMFIICLVFSVIGINRFGLLGENENALINKLPNSLQHNFNDNRSCED